MQRKAMKFLREWISARGSKPLVIRGARQVGKTWLVRELAAQENRILIEINFEQQIKFAEAFSSNDAKEIVTRLGSIFGTIDPRKSILFLDEIQAFPEALAKLRWFAEQMPELPVIAAGSLLEFVLSKHSFSMPVGRIEYMHLAPLSFAEFLAARSKQPLIDYIEAYTLDMIISTFIHEELIKLFKEYLIVGGMPEAVLAWSENYSLKEVNRIHTRILGTYRDDFARYKGRLDIQRLDEVIDAVPRFLGEKFTYKKANPAVRSTAIKQALDLLCMARICIKVKGTAANGVPLGAEVQDKFLKICFLDVGLCSASLKLTLEDVMRISEIDLINSGGIAEQVVGQLLQTLDEPYIEPVLYYWHREEKGSNAEIDYVIQHRTAIVPIEVKAGTSGTLKSLHVFMGLKKRKVALRFNSHIPNLTDIVVKDYTGGLVQYKLLSLPFYLLSELHRLLKTIDAAVNN